VEMFGPDAVTSYSRYGPVLACPGAPAVDGLLAPGSYDAVLAQSLVADQDSFDVTRGDLTLVVAPATQSPRAGECRSSLDQLPEGSGHHASFDRLPPVLGIVGEPLDPGVRMSNHGPLDLKDVVQGGPVLLVVDRENV